MLVEKFGSADDFYNFAGESSSDEEFNRLVSEFCNICFLEVLLFVTSNCKLTQL